MPCMGRATVDEHMHAAAPPVAWFQRMLRRKVIVHLTTDQSIEGVLMEQTDDGLILRAAKLLGEGSRSADTTIAGEVHIPRERIAFAQFDD